MRAMKTIKRELAHVGMFGQSGDGVLVTKKDLAEVAETFDGMSPVSLGHKLADWMPKFGDVTKVQLSADGNSLSGELEINDVLADAVDAKFYEHLSVGIPKRASDGKRYLHHVAFLGAVPPKIRDLKFLADLGAACFGDLAEGDVFADEPPASPSSTPQDVATALRRIADKGRTAWAFEDVTKALSELVAAATEMLVNGAKIPDSLKDPIGTFADQIRTAGSPGKEEDVEMKEENERLKKELADSKAAGLATAKEGLKTAMAGRIPAAKQDLVLELADRLGDADTVELADEAKPGEKKKVSALDVLRQVLEAIPKPVTEGRLDLGDHMDPEAGKKPATVSFDKA